MAAPNNLKLVTFTGADDSVNAEEIIKVAKDYPDTEWGILMASYQMMGGTRFPSGQWLLNQVPKMAEAGLNLSAHFCGQPMYELFVRGNFTFHKLPFAKNFKRIQLNFHGLEFCDVIHKNTQSVIDTYKDQFQFIFQADGVNDHLRGSGPHRLSLYDVSHGAGILPKEGWPKREKEDYIGYAGGLGPENIKDQLALIDTAAGEYGPYWIDMETKVRSNGDYLFDLKKVREVCEKVWA